MIGETFDFWDVVPLTRRFWFLNILAETGGGLEHDYNTVMMGSRWQTRDREDYTKWLGLAAHEFFHVWNVRRMRPEGIAEYDYRREQHTGSLWLAEGFTSYYDDLLLVRSDLITPIEYFKKLATHFHKLELTPGRLQISLDQSSHDAWTRAYQPNANAINANISYYTKGAVLAFVLDSRIRETTSNRKDLDDVMRLMFQRWGETPYPEDAFAEALAEEVSPELRAWFEPLVSEASELDIDAALENYGLLLDRKTPDPDEAESPVPAGLGINWSEDPHALVVEAVVHGFSAAEAGIIPGDELIAINDERVTPDNLDERQKRLYAGEPVELLISRHERLQRVRMITGLPRPDSYQIRVDRDISKGRLKRLESWLRIRLTD
jgi:predicted metalloprotease with PDZ domain